MKTCQALLWKARSLDLRAHLGSDDNMGAALGVCSEPGSRPRARVPCQHSPVLGPQHRGNLGTGRGLGAIRVSVLDGKMPGDRDKRHQSL